MVQIKQGDFFYSDISPVQKDYILRGYDLDYDREAIRNSLMNIFLVFLGSLPGKPKFGNPINTEVFDLFTYFSQQTLEDALRATLKTYEPRIQIEDVRVTLAPEYNRIIVDLDYSYVLDNAMIYDTLSLPYNHNSVSFLGGRIRPPQPMTDPRICVHAMPPA